MTTQPGVARNYPDPRRILTILAVTSLTAACQDQAPITRYTVPRERSTELARATPKPAQAARSTPTSGGRTERMLTGLVPQGDLTWFFKLTGPELLISDQADSFQRLIASVRFDPDPNAPSWDAPDDWRRLPASGMRYATLEIDTKEGPIELTVTPLKTSPGNYQDYVLANVNRWRTQLALDPIEKSELVPAGDGQGSVQEVRLANGETAFVVDLRGTAPATEPGMSMTSVPRTSSQPPATVAASATPAPSSPLHYDLPQGWSERPASGMRQAAFSVNDGSRTAEVTIIALAAGSGDLLSNVNRWRQQVQLEPISADTLAAERKPISMFGVEGHFVELVSPSSTMPAQAILGAIARHGNQDWFIKMMGDAQLIQNELDRFRTFAESISIHESDGAGHGH